MSDDSITFYSKVLLPEFEQGVDVSVEPSGRLTISQNSPDGHSVVSLSMHPRLAFALRDLLNKQLAERKAESNDIRRA